MSSLRTDKLGEVAVKKSGRFMGVMCRLHLHSCMREGHCVYILAHGWSFIS